MGILIPILTRGRRLGASLALFAVVLAGQATSSSAAPGAATGIFPDRLPSALSVNIERETVTLPLFKGRTADRRTTWYVITDSSTISGAKRRGVNFAGKLNNAGGTKAVQAGHSDHGTLVFSGTVNFGLHHVLVPGPTGFPPSRFAPGAEGDAAYSPLVRLSDGEIINAPQVANASGRSASVIAIDYRKRTVTLSLLPGFVDGQLTVYLHTDASSRLIAALEESTYAPNLNAAPGIGSDVPPSSRAAIIPVVNGIHGAGEPERQGLESTLLGQGDPLNVAQEQPSDPVHYTPVWDVTPVQWTPAAIAAGRRVQLHSQEQVREEALAGNIVSALPGTPDSGLGGLNAIGAISNCPIIAVFPG